jgi:hypothetical protein
MNNLQTEIVKNGNWKNKKIRERTYYANVYKI